MEIQGRYDEKFESIVDCYKKQFELGLDIGSSLALTYEGEIVIDIWAGTKDKAKSLPWEENTIPVQKMLHRLQLMCLLIRENWTSQLR
jgi:hypothetical protein